MTYLDYNYKVEFAQKEYDYINGYCREKPIDWTVSVWDLDNLEFSMKFNSPFLKIPSALLTDSELVIETAKTGIPIIQSTGMSTVEEIDSVVILLEKHAKEYVLLHCNSTYPARSDELNLRVIPKLKERYNCVVGYSGHEYGLDSTTLAVAMGAQVIERHFSLGHTMWGTDQRSSVEIQGMDKLHKQVDSVAGYLGDGVKRVYESELPIRKKLRNR